MKDKILHMITLKATWIVIISQIGVILNSLGALDSVGMEKYKLITNGVLVIIEAIGIFSIYKQEPIKDSDKLS